MHRILMLLPFVSLGCGSQNNGSDKTTSSVIIEESCPKSHSEWVSWRDQEIERLQPIAYQDVSTIVHRARNCEVPSEIRNFVDFAQATGRSKSKHTTLGLNIRDQEYFNMYPYPAMLDIPVALKDADFLSALDRFDLDEALDYLSTHGFKGLIFRSQHLPLPDDSQTKGRLLIQVETPSYDQFVQFGIHSPDEKPASSVSVISIDKIQRKAYFNDLWRIRTEDGEYLWSTRLKENGRLENCYSCHKSALIPIYPEPAYFDAERFGGFLGAFNKNMNRYEDVKIAHQDTYGFGPALGQPNPMRKDVLDECVPSGTDPKLIERHMNCTLCHNDTSRGRLNFPSALESQLPGGTSLAREFVVAGKMPPGNQLSEDERQTLFECLSIEYYGQNGIFERWLKNL